MRFNSHRAYQFLDRPCPGYRPSGPTTQSRIGHSHLQAHRPSHLLSLYSGMALMPGSEEEREFLEERAAIGEYEGGWPRPIAEAEALRALEHRRWLAGDVGVRHWLDPDP